MLSFSGSPVVVILSMMVMSWSVIAVFVACSVRESTQKADKTRSVKCCLEIDKCLDSPSTVCFPL